MANEQYVHAQNVPVDARIYDSLLALSKRYGIHLRLGPAVVSKKITEAMPVIIGIWDNTKGDCPCPHLEDILIGEDPKAYERVNTQLAKGVRLSYPNPAKALHGKASESAPEGIGQMIGIYLPLPAGELIRSHVTIDEAIKKMKIPV